MKENSSTIEYLKSLNINTSHINKDFEFEKIRVSVVMYATRKESVHSTSDVFDIETICTDKVGSMIYPSCFHKRFDEKEKAKLYYEDIINKIKSNDDDIILEAMKENNLSLL